MSQRKVPFNALPADVRKRLVEVFTFQADPTPILADQSSLGWAMAGWGTVSALGAGLLALVAWWDFGELYGDFPIQGLPFVVVYAGGGFLVAWGLLRIVQRALVGRALPFPPGRYLLPVDFVDA